jgi:uncharacterized membrane protein
MIQKLLRMLKTMIKPLVTIGLILALSLGHASDALAARSGGRIGGGSFRAPSRSYSAPSRGGGGGGYYAPGGGYATPFFFPMFGFGGGFGGLFTILMFLWIGNYLLQAFRNAGGTNLFDGQGNYNPSVSVAKVQVGLLAQARDLQSELDRIAESADTETPEGRARVLQETTLSLLRHPEYWVYGATSTDLIKLDQAEAKFNQLALAERSKFTEETLSNVKNQLRQAAEKPVLTGAGELANSDETPEYIMVTIIVGTETKVQLPTINGGNDMRQALNQIGSLPSDGNLAIEIVWTPQADGDTLTTDDILANYPDVKLV